MTQADLSYLLPLFELARGFLSDDSDRVASFGLGPPAPGSRLAKDDQGTDGYWVSVVVAQTVGAAIDHALALSALSERVATTSAPWTLTRGVVEPAATAVWVLNGRSRAVRRERALRVWHHDMDERGKWEKDLGQPPARGMSGSARATEIANLATSLGLRENQVSAKFNYGDTVAAAATVIGWNRKTAQARWREGSGFAHGRYWPMLHLTTPEGAERIRGGYGMVLAFAEDHHVELARLATGLLERAVDDYALSASPEGESAVVDLA